MNKGVEIVSSRRYKPAELLSAHARKSKAFGRAHSRPQSLRSFWPAAGIESSGSNHFGHAQYMKAELNRMGRIRLFPLLFQNSCSQTHSGQTGRACAVSPKTFAQQSLTFSKMFAFKSKVKTVAEKLSFKLRI